MDITNDMLVAAQGDRDVLPAAINFLVKRITEDRQKLAIAKAALRVTHIQSGIAIECKTFEEGDSHIVAVAEHVFADGRRGFVFKDGKSGYGWSARMDYRPNVKDKGRRLMDPGSFDYRTHQEAMTAAMEWAATGKIIKPSDFLQIAGPEDDIPQDWG